ncbi:MAG: sigma-70 family RNA polymerase sigma factor [Planctomycetaceae bacterium]|nr:sigma-70 family RNA polymerase sigma factor [Planctomycetaceae bacterium]
MSKWETRNTDTLSDQELLRQFEEGEEGAAAGLYFRYARRLFGLVRHEMSPALKRRVEADEIVQSVFRSFFRRARGKQYDIPEGDELWSLLLVMTLNKIRKKADYHTAQRRDIRRTVNPSNEAMAQFRTTDGSNEDEAVVMLKMVIDELVEGLHPVKAEMIRCRISGFEIQEIADRTQRSKRTVERTLQEFRDRLQTELSGINQNDVD